MLFNSKFNLIPVILIGMFSVSTAHQTIAAEIDKSQLEKQCRNITPQQRQMAKAAGYDVDAACKSLQNMGSNANESAMENRTRILPRNAEFAVDDRGVLNFDQESEGFERNEPTDNESKIGEKYSNEGELKRYGYDLFAGVPTTFAPATDIPVPVDYVMGPGDEILVQLLGKTNDQHQLVVSRKGSINFPELGPISVTGLKYSEATKLIQQKVSEQMIGVRAVISLGELRSIKVFVLGEAFKPGSYTVSSLSTMTNALFVSGGITNIGSLRNIQLKRQGALIANLDLYDLLQKGDTKNDARLMPGDVIYVPPVGKTVEISGEIKRPAIYELKGNDTLQSLVKIAGGYSSNAFPNLTQITRNNDNGFTTLLDIDLSNVSIKDVLLKNGDRVEVSTVLEELENVVTLSGAFQRARSVNWTKSLKLSNLITSVKDFKPNFDLNIGLIVRKDPLLQNISVLAFSVRDVLEGKADADLNMFPLDEVMVFKRKNNALLESTERQRSVNQTVTDTLRYIDEMDTHALVGEREEMLKPVIRRLLNQSTGGGLTKIVEISGNVSYPGRYPLTDNMSVRELVMLAGGLNEASYLGNAEITRRDLSNSELASIQHFNVNLGAELSGTNRFDLKAKDKLAIYATPEYRETLNISLNGEVRFPGAYEFRRGETLSQVISRAGGFTDMAHIDAAIFTRADLKIQEAKQLKELQERMREDIAASQLEDAAAGDSSSLKDSESLLNALTETTALGRLIINLDSIVSGTSDDIQLKDGDTLLVPTFRQEISVLGEVQHGSSHLYNEEWTIEDYLEKSGGLTNRADDDRIYVVRADGSVFLPNQSGWLSHHNESLKPGDTVVVPLDIDRIKSLALWSSVSQVVYQLALGAAAINSL